MYCAKCGSQVADDAVFCHSCGAPMGGPAPVSGGGSGAAAAVRAVYLGPWIIPALAGLLGGILAMVGVFTAWGEISGWISVDISGWDFATNGKVMGQNVGRETYACLGVSGAIIGLVAALALLAWPRSGGLWKPLLALGGILAITGAAWGIADIDTGSALGVSVGRGSGIYLTLVGGIVCLGGMLVPRR